MSPAEWAAQPVNWVFLAMGLLVLVSGLRVVTTRHMVHAALYLVLALAGTAGLFIILSAEFVAWVLVLVYIGAVVVLLLFGIMITRAPTGPEHAPDNPGKLVPALLSLVLFVLLSTVSVAAFSETPIAAVGEATPTEVLGQALLGRFVIPFEVVGFILLAALVGGITIARRDLTPAEEEDKWSR